MKLKNHPFFKKYKVIKIVLLVHLVTSVLVLTTQLVHGFINQDIAGSFKKPFENYKALYNPEKYLKKDIFVVDTAFVQSEVSSSQGKSTSKDHTIIRGNLLHSKIKKEIDCAYINSAVITGAYTYNQNVKTIEVLRNTLNDEVFYNDKTDLKSQKIDAVLGLYFYYSFIPLLIILFLLKKKSHN